MGKNIRERETTERKRAGMSENTKTPERRGIKEACPCSVDKRVSDNLVITVIAHKCEQEKHASPYLLSNEQ